METSQGSLTFTPGGVCLTVWIVKSSMLEDVWILIPADWPVMHNHDKKGKEDDEMYHELQWMSPLSDTMMNFIEEKSEERH